MKATHTDYKHIGHLRVEGCRGERFFDGPCAVDVLCVSPGSTLFKRMNRAGLPRWTKGRLFP